MFWAIAKMAPLSFAVATVSPVLIAFSVAARLPWVLSRYFNAVMASVFVLTLSMYASVLVCNGECTEGVVHHTAKGKPRAGGRLRIVSNRLADAAENFFPSEFLP